MAIVSETTFKRYKTYSIREKLKSKCLQNIESLFGKVYTKEVKKESALAENKNNRRKSMSDLKKYEVSFQPSTHVMMIKEK